MGQTESVDTDAQAVQNHPGSSPEAAKLVDTQLKVRFGFNMIKNQHFLDPFCCLASPTRAGTSVASLKIFPSSGSAAGNGSNADHLEFKASKFEITHYQVEKKIRVGCIGIGSRLKSLMMHGEEVDVVALADSARPAIDAALEGLKDHLPENVATYSDYKELLARDDLDWIMIGSKNNEHHEHCIAAFKSNRHVFCEKPLAISVQQCEEIREAQQKFSKLFVTGFVLRHAPMYRKIHEVVTEQKLLGKIISVEANEVLMPGHGGYIFRNWRRFREQAGPHILEKCCHDIDILNWLLDSVPSRVTALGGLDIFTPENKPESEEVAKLYKTWTWAYEDVDPFTTEKTIEDNLMGIMQYRNGAKVSFHTNCNASFGQRRLLICGVKGSLEADLVSGKIRYQIIGQEKVAGELKGAGAHGGGDYHIIEDLVRSMCAGAKPHASGEEGFRSALVCLALDKSRREDGAWVDLEVDWKKFDV